MSDLRMNNQVVAQWYKENMVGKKFRHFKGGIYIVTDIAIHSESASAMVIYKSYDNQRLTWARPLSMFLSEVDKEKYPNATQENRFEMVVE